MKDVTEFTDANFEQEVVKEKLLVLVDFWAEWCGPCRMLAPVVEKIADEYKKQVKVGKLNVDHNPLSATTYRVTGIPTLLLFKGGKVVDTMVGVAPEAQLRRMLDKHASKKSLSRGKKA